MIAVLWSLIVGAFWAGFVLVNLHNREWAETTFWATAIGCFLWQVVEEWWAARQERDE